MNFSRGVGLAALAASIVGTVATGCVVPPPPPPARPVPYDFDHDGKADLIYAHTDEPTWYRVGDPNPIGQTPGYPVAGDYDGNGTWELAGANRGTGQWTTLGARGTFTHTAPPGAGDHVFSVPGRYDTTGKTLAAWYSDLDGTWYIEGKAPLHFGVPDDGLGVQDQDFPVPGDYNGDGVDEPAVYRPRDRAFYVYGQPGSVQVGNLGDLPVPADYDGDGDTDPATYDGQTWRIAGQSDIVFPGDLPAPANHDGVGGAEPASWNSTTGVWSISSTGQNINLGAPVAGSYFAPATLAWNDVLIVIRQANLEHCVQNGTC